MEAAYSLRHVSLVGISVAGAWAWVIVGADGLLALLWAVLPTDGSESRWLRCLLNLNRWAGRLAAFLTWLTLAVVSVPLLWVQIAAVGVIVLVAPMIIDCLIVWWVDTSPTDGDLGWLRRPAFYLLTFVALGLLLLLGVHTSADLLVLVIGTALTAFIRFAVWFAWYWKIWRKETERETTRKDREPYADGAARRRVRIVLSLAVGAAVAMPAASLLRMWNAKQSQCGLDPEPWAVVAQRVRDADIAVLLIADNQFRALDGRRVGGHVDLVDAIVPVAVRPVEVDILSTESVRALGRSYRRLRSEFRGTRFGWAHMGDLADLSCTSEIDRALDFPRSFKAQDVLGVLPGNHDGYYTGNFEWSPEWAETCGGTGDESAVSRPEGVRNSIAGFLSQGDERAISSFPGEAFLARIAPLGHVGDRSVVGVFLDTSDYGRLRLGAAGVLGAISDEQVEWTAGSLRERFPDAYVVLFLHHPVETIGLMLDDSPIADFVRLLGDRALAIVAAHTHDASSGEVSIGGLDIDQHIVGSTTDDPQGAVVTIRRSEGRPSVEFSPLSALAVPRESADAGEIDCGAVLERASRDEYCREMLSAARARADVRATETCSATESGSPADVRCRQEVAAHRLLRCIARSGRYDDLDVAIPERPLEQPDRVAELLQEARRRRFYDEPHELLCLLDRISRDH